MRGVLRVQRVDDEGVALAAAHDRPVDVAIDGRRVWTFWTIRDTERRVGPPGPVPWPLRRAPWPEPLRRHLHGRAEVSVSDSATGERLFARDLALGSGVGEIRVQNRKGVDLGIDKSGRLVPTFAGRSRRNIASLLDATEAVIEALRSAGVEPFLAYGTLLGAVREGAVLGHDSDADLGYVSRHRYPVDVARESFEVQRRLVRQGWRISRYSGASFKIYVTEGRVTRGLDVFGGFLDEERLYLLGEVGTEFREEWLYPLGTATLEGRSMPVPARPEKLLEAMYGPAWQVPDPAFQFTTPDRTIRAFNDWFRGTQPGLRYWDRRSYADARRPLRPRPSPLARRAHRAATELGAEVLDVGAGRGADSLWLARRGHRVTAYDYVLRGLEPTAHLAAADGLHLDVRPLNLTEWRSVLAEGALLARRPGPKVVLASHLVDATSAPGREGLVRLCSMAMRDGGRLLADFHLLDPDDADVPDRLEWMVGRPDVEAFTTLVRDAGATEVDVRVVERGGRPTAEVVGAW